MVSVGAMNDSRDVWYRVEYKLCQMVGDKVMTVISETMFALTTVSALSDYNCKCICENFHC